MAFAFLNKIMRRNDTREEWRPLYATLVAEAREAHWYVQGQVPDTIDGRFDMILLITSLLMIRLEQCGQAGMNATALLTEVLVEDMEGQVREIGFGDLVVGKHVGQMMSALGGRLGAYRAGLEVNDLPSALVRNLYRGTRPDKSALLHMEKSVRELFSRLNNCGLDDLKAGACRS